MTIKQSRLRQVIAACLVGVCTNVSALDWWARSSTVGGYVMLDTATISGGVTVDHCRWITNSAGATSYLPSLYGSQTGDTAFVKLNVDFRGYRPKNCEEAVSMVNGAPIWDVPLSRESVYSRGPPGPANQLRFMVWANGVGGGGYLAYIYYSVPPSLSPPKPASCQALQAPSLDFGTIDPNEISGKKATSQVLVWCDKKASVRVRFMTREGLAIFQMDNGLTTYLKIDDNPGTAGSYQTVAENASSPARAFNLSAELLGTSGSVKPGAFSYTAVVRVDIL